MDETLLLGAYKTFGEHLGLEVDGTIEGKIRLLGTVGDVAVEMLFAPHVTHTTARLTNRAPFVLSIVTTSLIAKLSEMFHGTHVALGDPEFDKVFSVHAVDLEQLASILDGNARTLLRELALAGLHPSVDEGAVHLRRFSKRDIETEQTIQSDLNNTVRLAKAIDASFAAR